MLLLPETSKEIAALPQAVMHAVDRRGTAVQSGQTEMGAADLRRRLEGKDLRRWQQTFLPNCPSR